MKINNILIIFMCIFLLLDVFLLYKDRKNPRKTVLMDYISKISRILIWLGGTVSAWFLFFEIPNASSFLDAVFLFSLFYFLVIRIFVFRMK